MEGLSYEREKYKQRITDAAIEKGLKAYDAVCIDGPARCGKTWSAMHTSGSVFDPRKAGEGYPEEIPNGVRPTYIDMRSGLPGLNEVLDRALKESDETGRFVVTGCMTSAETPVMKKTTRVRMGTMTLYETGDSCGAVSLRRLCDGDVSPCLTGTVDKKTLARLIVRGGWPKLTDADAHDAQMALKDYASSVTAGAHAAETAMLAIAKSEGRVRTVSRMAGDMGESAVIFNKGIRFLGERCLTEDIDVRSVIGGVSKENARKERHLCDVSLVCALLGVTPEELASDIGTRTYFDSLCKHDLRLYAESFGARLFRYRDAEKRDIDAVIELPNGRWCAFDTETNTERLDEACTGLLKKCGDIEGLYGTPSAMCVVCGVCDMAYRREDGVFVVPLTSLAP